MKIWLVPTLAVVLVAMIAIAAFSLPPRWVFFAVAFCIVIGLGAAPVVFAVHTRRVELRGRSSRREANRDQSETERIS